MGKPIKFLGRLIDAYDSEDIDEMKKQNGMFEKSLDCHYPLRGPHQDLRCKIDNIRQTFLLSITEFPITENDREKAKAEYQSLKKVLK